MCKNWEKYGTCEFGDHCAFAHGETELREKIHVAPQYKTKRCRGFYEDGFCPYGSRCQFLHDEVPVYFRIAFIEIVDRGRRRIARSSS